MAINEKTSEEIQSMIEDITEVIVEKISDDGGIDPVFVFLYEEPDGEICTSILNVRWAIDDEDSKKFLVDVVLPNFKKKIRDDGNKIHSIAFIHEGWAYKLPKSFDANSKTDQQIINEYNKLRNSGIKSEVLTMSFHFDGGVVNYIYDMVRDGNNIKLENRQVVQEDYANKRGPQTFGKLMED